MNIKTRVYKQNRLRMATLRFGPHSVQTPWVDADELDSEIEKAKRDLDFEAGDLFDFMQARPRRDFDF